MVAVGYIYSNIAIDTRAIQLYPFGHYGTAVTPRRRREWTNGSVLPTGRGLSNQLTARTRRLSAAWVQPTNMTDAPGDSASPDWKRVRKKGAKMRRTLLMTVSILGLLPAPAWAADTGPVFTLGEVAVSTDAGENAARGVTTLPAEDMRRFDRETLDRALDLVPGVTTSSVGPRNERLVYIRGFHPGQVSLLVDGVPIYVPYDGYVDFRRYTTYDLSEIEVSKGFSSVLYGPNAMGGAINLVTRRPTKPFEAEALTEARFDSRGDAAGYTASTTVGTRQEHGYLQASGSRLLSDFYRVPDSFTPGRFENGGRRDNSYARDDKLSLKAGYTPNDTDEYVLNAFTQYGVKGTPPYGGNDPSVTARFWKWPYWDNRSVSFTSNTRLGSSYYVKTQVYHETLRNSLFSYDDTTYTTQRRPYAFQSWYDDRAYGGRIEAGGDILPNNTLKAAFSYRNDKHEQRNAGEPLQTFKDDTFSVALENTWRVTPVVDVIVGASYDWRQGIQAEDLDATKRRIVPFAVADAQAFNPQAGVVYRFSGTGNTHASVSHKTRFPTMKDRFSYRMGSAIPNPSLSPEKALNFEVGASEQFFGNTRVDGAVFYSRLRDAIQLVALNRTLSQMQNINNAVNSGFELGARSLLRDDTEIGGSYTFVHRENISNPAVKPIGVPRHKLFAFAEYRPLEDLKLIPSVEYNSSRYVISTGARASGFFLTNFRVSYDVTKNVSVVAAVNNLFDVNY